MSIQDVLKNSFLKEFDVTALDLSSMLQALVAALLLGVFICLVYTFFYGGVVYSRGYAVTLIGMSLLTCMVTLAISTNVVISLGMVGSLSIIRYRTAVKSPLDLLYMFWSVTVGITTGAGMVLLAAAVSALLFLLLLVVNFIPRSGKVYVVVLHYAGDAEPGIMQTLGRTRYQVKSRTMYRDRTELAIEVFCGKKKLDSLTRLREVEGVEDVTFVQYNGEYHG